jgi:hypothetical protein
MRCPSADDEDSCGYVVSISSVLIRRPRWRESEQLWWCA